MHKFTSIVKIHRFNSLSKIVVIYMEALYRSQKEVIDLVYSLIESLNLFKIQKALK